MIDIIDARDRSIAESLALIGRPAADESSRIRARAGEIVQEVRTGGDDAVRAITGRVDGIDLDEMAVAPSTLRNAADALDPALRSAIERTIETLTAWHEKTIPVEFEVETSPGVICGRVRRPISPVGLYIPSGTAPLPSTLLMLAVPARLAGCEEIVLCTPPKPVGIDPVIAAAANICGIEQVFAVGGAQAIAAMAFGTESIPRCGKIFGPGNSWVTEAKLQVAADPRGAAIDMPAGPSEVLVIADSEADPEWVAADLLSQAEHGETSQALLLTPSSDLAEDTSRAIEDQLRSLPRAAIADASIERSRILIVRDLENAYEISNSYAPEHLILNLDSPDLDRVRAAGSVFLGRWSPEAMGDYCSGTNHVLPTSGWARSYSGVSVASFTTTISWQKLSRNGLEDLGPVAETLAAAEGLEAHRRAIAVRRSR